MANKIFQGEVIESKDASFEGKRFNPETMKTEPSGEIIVGWSLVLLLNENAQKRFFLSDRNLCYNEAKSLVSGNRCRVVCNAQPGGGNEPKWVPIELKKLDDAGGEIPF